MIREWALRRAEAIMTSRPPDFEIGPPGDRYLQRWMLTPWSRVERGPDGTPTTWWGRVGHKLPAIYLHRFRHDDEDRALHDHPWDNASWILSSGYYEVVPVDPSRPSGAGTKVFRPEGSITFRRAESPHRVVLLRRWPDRNVPRTEPVPVEAVSLFFCWRRRRTFGFHCLRGWVDYRTFTDSRDRGAVGRGCE